MHPEETTVVMGFTVLLMTGLEVDLRRVVVILAMVVGAWGIVVRILARVVAIGALVVVRFAVVGWGAGVVVG